MIGAIQVSDRHTAPQYNLGGLDDDLPGRGKPSIVYFHQAPRLRGVGYVRKPTTTCSCVVWPRARKWPCKPTKIAPLSAMALLLERPQKSRSNFRVNSSHYGHSGLPPLGTTWASGSLFNGRNTSIHGCVLVGGLVMLPYCSLFRLGELHLSGRSILFVHRTGVRLPI